MNCLTTKNRRRVWPAIAVAVLFSGLCQGQPTETPTSDAYAWGFPLELDGDASFYTVELPLLVNRSVADSELRDAGVYNRAGLPVPRVFQVAQDTTSASEQRAALTALALYEQTDDSPDDLRLRLERNGDGTLLELNAAQTGADESTERLDAYLLDARDLDRWPQAIELAWPEDLAGFIGRITIEGSNNLEDWRTLGAGAVADLRESGTHVLQNRIPLDGGKQAFLRLSWRDLPDGWRLIGSTAIISDDSTSPVRRYTEIDSAGRDDDDGGYLFDLGGAPTIDRVRLDLPQANTIVNARIYYWQDRRQRWVQVAAGPHYRLGRGDASVNNPPARVSRLRARHFKVLIERGNPGGPPRLALGWRPDQLTFLAQGEPPFVLVAGRAEDERAQFPLERLYGDNAILGLAADGPTAAARLGERYALGGPTDLRPTRVISWRRWALWAALIVGVLLVLWMAVRVLRDG